jgi:hypothetical protein
MADFYVRLEFKNGGLTPYALEEIVCSLLGYEEIKF